MRPAKTCFSLLLLLFCVTAFSQDTTAVFQWQVTSKKLGPGQYALSFTTPGNPKWQLYTPEQVLSEVATASLSFADSSIRAQCISQQSGTVQARTSQVFEGMQEKVSGGPVNWTSTIHIQGAVPASMIQEMPDAQDCRKVSRTSCFSGARGDGAFMACTRQDP